ncbi:putative alpha/beta superfamily hydrolase [Streptococcus pneumoniae]|nr:putative alpha/beta superfamily hydrolase [Streptococcus pneumoniae]
MKLIFLHGLGQSAESWKEVRNLLTDYPSEAIELFPFTIYQIFEL